MPKDHGLETIVMTSLRSTASSRLLLPLLLLGLVFAGCGPSAPDSLTIFAAASLRDLLQEAGTAFEAAHGVRPTFNFAGSNTLAQQIDAAPSSADVFVSADAHWVKFLGERGRAVPGSRREVFTNRLVVIAHRAAAYELEELAALPELGFRHLALADPGAVPAGRYARAALEDAGIYAAVAETVAPALDVRAALALVETDPEIVGIVYRTDARTSEQVRVLLEVPETDEARVSYHAVVLHDSARPDLAGTFVDFLLSDEGRRISERHGFLGPHE